MSAERWTTLPCGINPERLLSYVAEHTRPDVGSHEAGCPYCQAAIVELTQLWDPVTRWASRDVPVPHRFAAAVTNRVRRLLQSPRHAAAATTHGNTSVTSWVLGLIASAATRDTPGVTKITGSPAESRRRPAIRYGADGVDITEIDASDIIVTVGIEVQPVKDLERLADTVRHNIIQAIREQTHINAAEVDISIDDISTNDIENGPHR
jgi:uncharacterized alkaline shock family protein YloU